MIHIQSYAPDGFIALDNSALIYPTTEATFNANTFRVSVDVKQTIKPEILELALLEMFERCVYAKVSLHSGFFWYYLSPNDNPPILHPELPYPSGRIAFKQNNGYLFKVLYSTHRIAMEWFHALTDGTGALNYLKLLLERYYHLSGIAEFTFKGGLDFNGRPEIQEFSDPFQHLYDRSLPAFPTGGAAYHRKGFGAYDDRVKVVSAMVDSATLRTRSKQQGATVTEYLSAVLLYCLQEFQRKEILVQKRRKPIRLSVPMNLRKIFGYETQRNFTLFAVIGIEPALGQYSFEEILKKVHLELGLAQDPKRILSQIKRNVGGERNPLIKFAPNALKNPLFKLLSNSLGDDLYSAVISNLGLVDLPPEFASSLSRMDFYLSPGKLNKVALAIIGYKEKVVINFTSFLNSDTELERLFCTFLVEDGIPVDVSTNRNGNEEE